MPRYDDFTSQMGDEAGALHMKNAFDKNVGHTHKQVAGGVMDEGQGGPITIESIDQALAGATNTGTLWQIISWIVKQIKAITGSTNWYDSITKSLKDIWDEIVKRDNRFQLSGNIDSDLVVGGTTLISIHKISRLVPAGKKIVLKRVNYNLDGNMNLRLKVYGLYYTWTSSGNSGDESPGFNLVLDSGSSGVTVQIYNISGSPVTALRGSGWWLELSVE